MLMMNKYHCLSLTTSIRSISHACGVCEKYGREYFFSNVFSFQSGSCGFTDGCADEDDDSVVKPIDSSTFVGIFFVFQGII